MTLCDECANYSVECCDDHSCAKCKIAEKNQACLDAARVFENEREHGMADEEALQPILHGTFAALYGIPETDQGTDVTDPHYQILMCVAFRGVVGTVDCEKLRRATNTVTLAFLSFMSTCSEETFVYHRGNHSPSATIKRTHEFIKHSLSERQDLQENHVAGCLRLLYYACNYLVQTSDSTHPHIDTFTEDLCRKQYFEYIVKSVEKGPELACVASKFFPLLSERDYDDILTERYLDVIVQRSDSFNKFTSALGHVFGCIARKKFFRAHRIVAKYDGAVFYQVVETIQKDISEYERFFRLVNINGPRCPIEIDVRKLNAALLDVRAYLNTVLVGGFLKGSYCITEFMGLYYHQNIAESLDGLDKFLHTPGIPDRDLDYKRAEVLVHCEEARATLRAFSSGASSGLASVCTTLFLAGFPFPAVEIIVAHSHMAHLVWLGDELPRRVGVCQRSVETRSAAKDN